jgi:hypothetical protein
MSEVLYLYGFVPRDAPPPSSALSGLDGADVELMDAGGFQAVISRLADPVYGSDELHERLKDLAWVGARGLAHERVVTWFVDCSTIVPARLLTIFSSPPALSDRAQEVRHEVEEALARFSQAREWDLKVSYRTDELLPHVGAISEEVAELDRAMGAARPGRRYLLQRRRDELARTECVSAARRIARELLDALAPQVHDVVELEVPDVREGLPVVLNAAVLVPRHAEEDVRASVTARGAELADLGVHVTFTGPWAPYRFAAAEPHG